MKKNLIIVLIVVLIFLSACAKWGEAEEEFIVIYNGEKYIMEDSNYFIKSIWRPTLKTTGEEVNVFYGQVSEKEKANNCTAITYKNDTEKNILSLGAVFFVKESYYKTLPVFQEVKYDQVERIILECLDGTTYEVKDSGNKKVLFEQLQQIATSKEKEKNWVDIQQCPDDYDSNPISIYMILKDIPLAMEVGWYYEENEGKERYYVPNIRVDEVSTNIWIMDDDMMKILDTATENGEIEKVFEMQHDD